MDNEASHDLWTLINTVNLSHRKKKLFLVNCLNHIKDKFSGKDLKALESLNLYIADKISKNQAKQIGKRAKLDYVIREVLQNVTNHKMPPNSVFLSCNSLACKFTRDDSLYTNLISDKYDAEMRWQWDLLRHMTNNKMRPTYAR